MPKDETRKPPDRERMDSRIQWMQQRKSLHTKADQACSHAASSFKYRCTFKAMLSSKAQ